MAVFTTKSQRIFCARCNRPAFSLRECPHEGVNKAFGNLICFYCCRQCKHHTTVPFCGAIGCELWKKDVTTSDTSRTSKQR